MRDFGAVTIVERARRGETITYGELWDAVNRQMGRDIGKAWRQVPQLLRHIGEDSFERFEFIITALVVTDDFGEHPSEGFFRLAARLGVLHESEAPEKGQPWKVMKQRQRQFWIEECDKVFAFVADTSGLDLK